ncbi:hypothetical protein N7462_007931 [Penicillium macrosclerotiorum]|uniref:uncharacterized protein n=1 Tax=Penicillium macrosclerotiorum TaxID=303699 RepID=UPI0025491FA4|nr:uncharacterized protein N7462_007931 [Penicillium macrosclerotiorum]KAJ5679687.1 hypothetical protein N7462_007931 [Penicillium macrosclerotiorum]
MPLTTSIPLPQTFTHTTATHSYQVHYTTLGSPSSPPLIFIHGTPWSSFVWATHARALALHFHIHLFDCPGFGTSPPGTPLPHTSITPETALDSDLAEQTRVFAALYAHWARAWGGAAPHVVAHDVGGLLALRAVLMHGCALASLCLVDVVAVGPFETPLFKLIAAHEGVFGALPGPMFAGVVEGYIREAAWAEIGTEVMEALKKPWIQNDQGRMGFLRQMVQASRRSVEEVEEQYGKVGEKMPVMVIWGAEDQWLPVETASRVKEKVQAREMVLIEGAGHLVMYDQPESFGVELTWWLKSVG